MPDLTPLEVAEKLESLVDYAGDTLDDALEFNLRHTVDAAASYLRQIAAGEYRPVVRCAACKYCEKLDGTYANGELFHGYVCNYFRHEILTRDFCSCGALMDESRDGNSHIGKDDAT